MASRMRYVVAAVMLIGLASSLAIAAGVSEVSFWSCTAPKGADYREYCFNSTLPAFEGAYIRVPSLFKKRDEGRYTMRTQMVGADGLSTINLIADGRENGNIFILYNGTGVFEKLQMIGASVTDSAGGITYYWGLYTFDILSLEYPVEGVPDGKDGLRKYSLRCDLAPKDSGYFAISTESSLPQLVGTKWNVVGLEKLPTGWNLAELKGMLESGATLDFVIHDTGHTANTAMFYNGTGDMKAYHFMHFTTPKPSFFEEGYCLHNGLYYVDTEAEMPLVMPAPPPLPEVMPDRVMAKMPLEAVFWTVPAPKGANYQSYCFSSNVPGLEGACIKTPVIEEKGDGRFLMKAEIVAADGRSTIKMIASGKDGGNAFLLHGGSGVFEKLVMIGFTSSDEAGVGYHWGFYTRDVSSMDVLGMPASKDNAKRFISECMAEPPKSQPFGYFRNSDWPPLEGAGAYIVSVDILPSGYFYLVAYFENDNGSKTDIYAEGDLGTSSDMGLITSGTGDFEGCHGFYFTASKPVLKVERHGYHEGMYYFDTEAEAPLKIPEMPNLPVAVPIQHPGRDYTNVFFLELSPGLNMVSLPLEPVNSLTARSFAEMVRATVVITLDEKRQKFIGFTLNAPDDGFPIEGGKGYIVNTPEGGVVSFIGAAWINEPPVSEAPRITDSAWAFVVSGEVRRGGDYLVTVRNLRTDEIVAAETTTRGSGYFAAAWADLNRKSVVRAGDKVEVTVTDFKGRPVCQPLIRLITADDIRRAYLNVKLDVGDPIPQKSALGQNFPNPFNPETWIPFQLAGRSEVRITIYDSAGHIVRALHLGEKKAGFYTSRSEAAYWDGCNEAGERVSSGIYFYRLQAGEFSAMRRMVIVK